MVLNKLELTLRVDIVDILVKILQMKTFCAADVNVGMGVK